MLGLSLTQATLVTAYSTWAVVVAQLVEQSLPTPEISGSSPDFRIISSTNCTIEKTKINKKRPGMAHLLRTFST